MDITQCQCFNSPSGFTLSDVSRETGRRPETVRRYLIDMAERGELLCRDMVNGNGHTVTQYTLRAPSASSVLKTSWHPFQAAAARLNAVTNPQGGGL